MPPANDRPGSLSAMTAAAIVGVQVGSAMVATRFVIDQLGPGSIAWLRYAIGALCLLPALWLGARVRFAKSDLLPMALLGIGQFGVLIALLNIGLQYISSGRAALLFTTLPLMAMLLAAALGLERLSTLRVLGVLLSIAGVGFALGDALLVGANAQDQWPGVLAVLASALCGAICTVYYRPYLRRYATMHVSLYSMAAAVVALSLPALAEGLITDAVDLTRGEWGAVAFLGIGSGLGYFLWLWALNHAGPTRVTVFLALSPVTATVLGSWWLDERLSPLQMAGLVLVLAGLWFATREVTQPARPV